MLRYKWQVALGEQIVDIEAFKELLKQSKGLVKIRDQYLYFDEKETKTLADKLSAPPRITGAKLLQIALAEEYDGAPVWLSDELKAQIRALMDIDLVSPP